MKKICLALFSSLIVYACTDNEYNTCSVEDPIQDLAWLSQSVQRLEQDTSAFARSYSVSQAEYQGETVFIFNTCCLTCNMVFPVFDCSGDALGVLGDGEENVDTDLVLHTTTIWQSEDFQCYE